MPWRAVVRRLGASLVVLWLISVIIFVASQVLPGSPGRAILGDQATEEAVAALNARLGYDAPLHERYLDWVGGLLRGDLGTSYAYGVPVTELLAEPLVRSLQLGAMAFALGIPLAVVLGMAAARRPGGLLDRFVVGLGLIMTVTPAFVIGIVLIVVFAVTLDWLPVNAITPRDAAGLEWLRHLLLPALTLVAVLFGYVARVTRAGFVEEMRTGYARAARLKGASETRVVLVHVARNALAPTAVVIATQAGYLIGGAVVVERLYNYPGIGLAILNASGNVDIPVLASGVMLMGVIQIFFFLVADIVLVALSPRMRSSA